MESIEKNKIVRQQPAKEMIDNASQSNSTNTEATNQPLDIDYSTISIVDKDPMEGHVFYTDVTRGKGLIELYKSVEGLVRRNCYDYLLNYIYNDYRGKVCVLYGLRRTGKSTLLFQLIKALDVEKTAYIRLQNSNTMGDLIKDINYLKEHGIKYFLVDEVTLLSDFIGSAAAISDIYCQMGSKVILSGTDSLGFDFAKRDELYDRAITIHTSYISFKEFSEVLHKNDVDEYIEYGGTLQKENTSFDEIAFEDPIAFKDDKTTKRYIDSAISQNIQNSLKNYKFGSRFYDLRELYEKNELTNVINRIVENMNHEFVLSVIEAEFKSHDLGSARQMLVNSDDDKLQTALYDIDAKSVVNTLKRIMSIKEKQETKVKITTRVLAQVKDYLYDLDLIKDVEIRRADGVIEKQTVFTQPGMRYSIAKALCYALMQDEYFKEMAEEHKGIILNKILNDVKGRMLEDIVLLESTYRKKKDEVVFKYIDNSMHAECDMIKYNKKTNSFEIYEIKHSKKVEAKSQAKHLNNLDFTRSLSKKFGLLKGKYVLYKGDLAQEVGTVKYLNVEFYLKRL